MRHFLFFFSNRPSDMLSTDAYYYLHQRLVCVGSLSSSSPYSTALHIHARLKRNAPLRPTTKQTSKQAPSHRSSPFLAWPLSPFSTTVTAATPRATGTLAAAYNSSSFASYFFRRYHPCLALPLRDITAYPFPPACSLAHLGY